MNKKLHLLFFITYFSFNISAQMKVNKLIGTLYIDINDNQRKDLDEKVLTDIKLSIYNENQSKNVFINSTVTDINGQFVFDSLKIGEKYYFSFEDSNFRQNKYNANDLYNGKVNIGRIPFPAVKFFAFQDLNRNQNLDKNEPLLKDIFVYTYTDGFYLSFINNTDSLGFYYEGVFADRFRFDERNSFWKLDFTETYKKYYNEILNRNITEVYGGFTSLSKGLVYGFVYNDYDKDNKWNGDGNNEIGNRDPSTDANFEYGEPNVKLKIFDVSKSIFVDSTVTNKWGQFVFSNLKKGKYQLFILGEEIFTFSGNSKNVNLENQLILSFEILDESSLNNVFTWGLNKKKIIPLDKNDLKFVAKTVAYNNILLSWDNSLVGKSDTLELQKSLNNVLFKTINKSSQINNGEYSDNSISPNTKYFYRIRIKKGDNFTNFSDTVSATSANVLGVEILENNTPSVYPNPLETFVNITNDNRTIDKIEIYSLIGKNIIVHDIISDEKVIKINLDKLVSGMYIVDIIDKKGNHIYKKIAKK